MSSPLFGDEMEKISRENIDALNIHFWSLLRNEQVCQQWGISFQDQYVWSKGRFARVNHFCSAYMCITGVQHACNDNVTGWGC